jgi:hypothetical protein
MMKSKRSLFYVVFLLLFILTGAALLIYFLQDSSKRQVVAFTPISGPVVNPLMGWAPWANADSINQPHTLVYMDLTWRDFEPTEGNYDFTNFEKSQQMARWRREGDRVVFRFVLDKPGDTAHKDIPDWLFEQINGDGESYDNQYGKGFSPNYANPVLIKYHLLAIKALGNKYGRDGFFAFVELGSLGHWGEWHESPELKQLPPENIRDLYVKDYIDAFPGTRLLLRRPFTIAQTSSLGLYNDMTGSVEDTNIWLDWIQNGGDYLPDEPNTLVPMPNGWQLAPVGGEQAPPMSNEEIYAANIDATLRLLKASHTTFIGPGGPYQIPLNSPLQAGVDQVLAAIGYRIYIVKAEMPLSIRFGREAQIKLSFANAGIAPFYYNWPARLYLFDESGNTIKTYPLDMDLRKILPGQTYDVSIAIPVDTLADGKYSIGFAAIDPLTGKPGIKLANESPRQDLIQEAGTFEVNWLFNFQK